jgi:hypothetical protein
MGWGEGRSPAIRGRAEAGENTLAFEVAPPGPAESRRNSVDLRVQSVVVEGPTDPSEWVRPPNFERFFDRDDPGPPRGDGPTPICPQVLADRAFRRPVDARTLDRLVAIAEESWDQPGGTVSAGVGRAMVAVIASPRFLFRFESSIPDASTRKVRPVSTSTRCFPALVLPLGDDAGRRVASPWPPVGSSARIWPGRSSGCWPTGGRSR